MNDLQSTDEEYKLWWLILHMRRAMRKARARELFQYGISPEEAAVLFITQTRGPRVTPAEISRCILREPHSTFGLLSRMEKKGLVKKVKDLDKKNLIRVVLTEKGRKAYYQSTKRESINKIVSSLSKEERQQLRKLLEKLRDKAFEELGINYKPRFLQS